MKLVSRYFLFDKNGDLVLEISSDFSPEHMRQMRDVYGVIYPKRAPLKVVAVDVLGDKHDVPLDSYETN